MASIHTKFSALLLAAAGAAVTSRAIAHSPVEVLHIVSRSPSDVILATNRGLIFGDLNTRDWSLLCNEMMALSTTEPYRVVALPSGRLLVASSDGLRFSDDRGCSWQPLPSLPELSIPALLASASDPQRLYITTYGPGEGAVRVSSNGGESFETLTAVPDSEFPNALLVSATNPVHLYFATIGLDAERKLAFHVSHSADGGATWERTKVPLTTEERGVQLLAINPARPEEILARATASEPALGERLLWSVDGGKTFSSPVTLKELKTAGFSPDGALAYVAGVDGLWRATNPERTFEQVPMTARISYVEDLGNELLASGYYAGIEALRDGVATSEKAGALSFQRWMEFEEVTRLATCPASAMIEETCDFAWQDWTLENLSGTDAGVSDGGTPDASTLTPDAGLAGLDAGAGGPDEPTATRDAGAEPSGEKPASDDDGCAVNSAARGQSLWLAALALLLGLRPRRRG